MIQHNHLALSPSGPVLMSLKPGTRVANPYPETPAEKGLVRQLSSLRFEMGPADGAVTRTDLNFMEEVDGVNEHWVFCKDDR